jgi:methylmalonyl-CoA/ethylmalonyl-CoA epimerase
VERTDLDHVALAFEQAFDGFDRYRGDLGGVFIGGAVDPGFYWGQLRYANGMRVEILEPADLARDDFLRRFLDRNGPGPHHLTFKVPDIRAALARVRQAGYEPPRVNLEHELWKEVFLHPKEAHGIVVQLAWSAPVEEPESDGLPPTRARGPVQLERVTHLVADLEGALSLFEGLLEGKRVDEGDMGGRWVELAWPGGGRLRLWQADRGAPADWLGNRSGRVHHLAFAMPEPDAVPDARPMGAGLYEVAPERNHGTRLLLTGAE